MVSGRHAGRTLENPEIFQVEESTLQNEYVPVVRLPHVLRPMRNRVYRAEILPKACAYVLSGWQSVFLPLSIERVYISHMKPAFFSQLA